MTTSISIKSSKGYYIDEPYPKIYLEKIPSIMLEYPSSKLNKQGLQSRNNLRYRTQPVTLTEIYETEEGNKIENKHSTLAGAIRRMARKKVPLKNFLEQQRLKIKEEFNETDAN